jgi:hypothetical protein
MKEHPLAAIFPMLPDDELQDLADDIKAHGLIQPIAICEYEGEDTILDGRNRYAACKIAGVEPRFERISGGDIRPVVAAANLKRRHLSKAQRAFLHATIYPEPEKGGRGKKLSEIPDGLSREHWKNLVSEARLVLRHSQALGEEVLAGRITLDKAVEKVRIEQNIAEADEAKMTTLRREAPDLVELVTEGRMSLGEAHAALGDRRRRIREAIEDGKRAAELGLIGFVTAVATIGSAMGVTDEIVLDPERVSRVNEAVRVLNDLAARKRS